MKIILSALCAAMVTFTGLSQAFSQELVVYSARKEHLIKPLFDAYEKKTGVTVRYVTGKAPVLLERLKSEGSRTPADILMTVDAGNLWHAANEGVLQPVSSEVLAANVPANLRDPQNRWFGLSKRARTIVYSTERVTPSELSTYENLADPAWKGRLILRTSKKVYNQSLVAMLMAEHGEADTQALVEGWVSNLAAPPFSSDTKALEAIMAGQGDVAVVNTYYFGRLQKKNPGLPLAIFWPNQKAGGVHVNVSGAGVTKHASHPEAAKAFLEWLSGPEAQNLFADANMEYPVNPAVKPHGAVAAWGDFKGSDLGLEKAGELQADAIKLMDRAGYK
ncbi:Fe(3+) ABC transporter substrate-binding protein [Desulfoluna butyratoxydans]|uniref:Bacterial extracellular solute-binding protein n=1 Tax=Desulfoluna butyratoxydans TaxID=231438 RepID=A0A4U8YPF5_9BACT|nr:Fe(3+) ABC transporter substrate-binding protein [Desulfoluna butyratoxydans]VFQ45661.1 bacterial extracellular solute-binding protein [Desulfoluna butyratoxydans]